MLWQLISGLLFFAGIVLHVHDGGSLALGKPLHPETGAPTAGYWLLFLALGVKCAFPGLHTWLVDAYPEAAIVLVSMRAEPEYDRAGREAGALGFIAKRELSAESIKSLLRGQQQELVA